MPQTGTGGRSGDGHHDMTCNFGSQPLLELTRDKTHAADDLNQVLSMGQVLP